MRRKTASQLICQAFKIPQQTIFQDYKCALKAGFTHFGRLYVGEQHIMFNSNMFGIVKKIVFPIDDILKVTQLPGNGLSIVQKGETEHIFTGFKNNHAFKIVNALWKRETIASEVLKETNEEENHQIVVELIGKDSLPPKTLDDGNVEANFFNPQLVEAQKQKVVEFSLPCSVEQFYQFFLADNASVYSRRKHLQSNLSQKIQITEWKKNQQLSAEVREISALIKVKGVPFKSAAPLNQVWSLRRSSKDELTYHVSSQLSDIPYSSIFTCEEHITVTSQSETKCKLQSDVAIVFSKHTYLKNTILTRTYDDIKQDYHLWIRNVKEILEKMRKQDQDKRKHEQQKLLRKGSSSSIIVEYEQESLPKSNINPYLSKPVSVIASAPTPSSSSLQKNIMLLIKLVIVLIVICSLNLLLNIFQKRQSCNSGSINL